MRAAALGRRQKGAGMNKSEKFWNKCARKYSKEKIKDEEGYRKTLEDTQKYLGQEKIVLEIGCGTGTTALSWPLM